MARTNLQALQAWREEVESRHDEPLWVVVPDTLVGIVYTIDGTFEDLALMRMAYGCRYTYTRRPSTRPGVTRFDFVPKVERLVADEDTCRTIAKVLARNRVHGMLRQTTRRGGERF